MHTTRTSGIFGDRIEKSVLSSKTQWKFSHLHEASRDRLRTEQRRPDGMAGLSRQTIITMGLLPRFSLISEKY